MRSAVHHIAVLSAVAFAVVVAGAVQAKESAAKAPSTKAAASAQVSTGTIDVLSGTVRIERAGVLSDATTGAAVAPGDTVVTDADGRAVLKLGPGSEVRVGPGTRLRLDQMDTSELGRFTLSDGAVLYSRTGIGPAPRVAFSAPFGEVAGKVARVFLGRVEGQFGVAVMRGSANVVAKDASLHLEPGDAVDIPRNPDMPAVVQPWSEARLRLAMSLVE